MIRQYEPPETIASLRRIDRDGNDEGYEDCVAGIQCQPKGRLQIDLRALRPMRFNDRDSLVIELDINELLGCIAENLRKAVKE